MLVPCALLLWMAGLGVLPVAHSIRVGLFRSSENLNNITLTCTRSDFIRLVAADFWVNSTDLPLTAILPTYKKGRGRIQFLLHPDIEGSYYCGIISNKRVSSNNWTLVAYPTQRKIFSHFYAAEVGSSITLSCPFARGALTQHYFYSWMKRNKTIVKNMRHIPHFFGNSMDFSLTIQNVVLFDSSEYSCRVFVENPIGNNWVVDSDPIQLSVCGTMTLENRCAVISSPAASKLALSTVSSLTPSTPLVPSTTPVSSSVSLTSNTTLVMNPPSRSPLNNYEVAGIAVGGFVAILICAASVGAVVIIKRCKNRRRQQFTHCDQDNQALSQSTLGEENNSRVQVNVANSVSRPADDTARRDPSHSDNHNRGSQNLETPSGCEGPECAVPLGDTQNASTMDQLQSQEHSVPPSEGTAPTTGIPADLPISETHQRNRNTPSVRSGFEGQSRKDSGMSPLSDAVTNSLVQSRSCPSRSTETFPLQTTGDYQDELMLLGPVRALVCDSKGTRFSIPEHGITLSFPQGAVPDTVEIEVGVAIHGLFDFPDDLRPISVLVWVQAKNSDFEFQKPVKISLPHYLKLSKNDAHDNSNLGLGFMMTDGEEDEHQHLIFKEGAKEQVSYKQTRAIISTTHFCYMCLSAKSSVIAEKGCYLLTQVQPESIKSLRWQIHFCVSYNLCSFIEMIKQLYNDQGKVVSQTFKFTFPPKETKSELKINLQTPEKGWQLIFPANKVAIPQPDVEFWEDDVSVLKNRVMLQLFPPRVTVEVAGEGAFGNTTQLFSFEGAQQRLESQVHLCLVRIPASQSCPDRMVTLPECQELELAQHTNTLQPSRAISLSALVPHPSTRTITSRRNYPGHMVSLSQYKAHPDEPTGQELFDVMNEIAAKMGSNWSTLISILGIPDDTEQEIRNDYKGLKEQIHRMLQVWKQLHQHDGTNTRAHLAAILGRANLHSAVKILERHSQS